MDRKKNIILITYGNFPYGGASANYVRYFTTGLSNLNNKIEVVLPTGNYYGSKIDYNKSRTGSIGNVRYKHLCLLNHPKNIIGKIIDNICGTVISFAYLLKKWWQRGIDVIIIYNVSFIEISILLYAKMILRKKVLLILPDFYEKPNESYFSLELLKWYSFYFSMRYFIKYADGFIVFSFYLQQYVKNILTRKKPIIIVPNLIDPKKFNKNVPRYCEDKTTIGYIGTPTRKDGVVDLIKSFSVLNKKYPDTHLLIIGDIPSEKTIIPSLKEFAKDLGVLANITFTGLVSHDKVPSLLQSCQILALTRPRGVFAEAGFPTKLGEYFACKKPVVITDVGDIPKYFINEKHVILVEAENIDSITNGFSKLLAEPGLTKRLSNNAYTWMENNLDYKNVAKHTDWFIECVLKYS